jgi:hypothetical protein
MLFSPDAIDKMPLAMLGWKYETLQWRRAAVDEEVSP